MQFHMMMLLDVLGKIAWVRYDFLSQGKISDIHVRCARNRFTSGLLIYDGRTCDKYTVTYWICVKSLFSRKCVAIQWAMKYTFNVRLHLLHYLIVTKPCTCKTHSLLNNVIFSKTSLAGSYKSHDK